ncbi:MAG: 2,3-bisphosphoglycerate-independent phosphoglycerate mutase [Halobacteriales archaeon]|nr:2,3-bisphosphoglycerate-independent phosphoglycerate mutase [Halobacteriales archaeon]
MSPPRGVLLCILDGFGLREDRRGNAVALAKLPNLHRWMQGCAKLEASGLAVGLPRGTMGNSEVGHLAIGTGQVVYQSLARIGLSIEDKGFFANPALVAAVDASRGKTLHLVGLVSDGGVHSHLDHLLALLDLAAQRGQHDVAVHAILDGRDTPAREALKHLDKVQHRMGALRTGRVADVGGRFFAMDRDQRWERVKQGFDAMATGKAPVAKGWKEAVEQAYARGETDEFVTPTRLLPGKQGLLKRSEPVILFNFRPDRMRQLAHALAAPSFAPFPREPGPWPVTTMAQLDATLPCPAAFPAQEPRDTLGEVVARTGRTQLRIAETEKYAHVTYFFNGGREGELPGEARILVPSKRDQPTYDLVPEMSAREVTEALLGELRAKEHALVVLNLANPDMCGHTGVLDATVRGCEVVDECLGRIVALAQERGYEVLITSDHGNAEVMEMRGEPHKAHTTNPVPLIHLGARPGKLKDGGLSDVAPTVLDLLGLPKPAAMTGKSLFA